MLHQIGGVSKLVRPEGIVRPRWTDNVLTIFGPNSEPAESFVPLPLGRPAGRLGPLTLDRVVGELVQVEI